MGAYDIPLAIVGDTLQRLGDCQDGTVWFQKGEDHASVECRDIRTQEGDACDIAKVSSFAFPIIPSLSAMKHRRDAKLCAGTLQQ